MIRNHWIKIFIAGAALRVITSYEERRPALLTRSAAFFATFDKWRLTAWLLAVFGVQWKYNICHILVETEGFLKENGRIEERFLWLRLALPLVSESFERTCTNHCNTCITISFHMIRKGYNLSSHTALKMS